MSAVLSILLIGCGSPAVSPSAAARASGDGSAAGIVAELSDGGLVCGPVTQRTVATYVADTVSCAVDGADLVIRTFADSADRDRFLGASDEIVKQTSVEIDALPKVVGATWIITTDDPETASRVQALLGGEIR